ncbi:MAG: hypothetical protein HY016_00740 [Nitrosomonadales bacterium]|nr:hypothetical protein [Nitrosomonadales bacterium]
MHAWMKSVVEMVVLAVMLSCNAFGATPAKPAAAKAAPLSQSYVWYDGDRERQVWLNPQLVAEFNPGSQGEHAIKSAYATAQAMSPKRGQGGVRLWKLNDTATSAMGKLKSAHPQGKYSVVLHDGGSDAGRMRALPGNIIVYLNPQWDQAAVSNWLSLHKLEVVKKLEIGPNIYVIKTGPGIEALNTANALYKSGEVKAAFPDWWQEMATR